MGGGSQKSWCQQIPSLCWQMATGSVSVWARQGSSKDGRALCWQAWKGQIPLQSGCPLTIGLIRGCRNISGSVCCELAVFVGLGGI